MVTYQETGDQRHGNQVKIVLFVISLLIGSVVFTGMMMALYYFDLLTPWGLLFMVPFSLVILPWIILKMLPWLSRKITGDRSNIDLRHFADPQEKNIIENEDEIKS